MNCVCSDFLIPKAMARFPCGKMIIWMWCGSPLRGPLHYCCTIQWIPDRQNTHPFNGMSSHRGSQLIILRSHNYRPPWTTHLQDDQIHCCLGLRLGPLLFCERHFCHKQTEILWNGTWDGYFSSYHWECGEQLVHLLGLSSHPCSFDSYLRRHLRCSREWLRKPLLSYR